MTIYELFRTLKSSVEVIMMSNKDTLLGRKTVEKWEKEKGLNLDKKVDIIEPTDFEIILIYVDIDIY